MSRHGCLFEANYGLVSRLMEGRRMRFSWVSVSRREQLEEVSILLPEKMFVAARLMTLALLVPGLLPGTPMNIEIQLKQHQEPEATADYVPKSHMH